MPDGLVPTIWVVESSFFSLLLLNVSNSCLDNSEQANAVRFLLNTDVKNNTKQLVRHQHHSYVKASKRALDAYQAAFYDHERNQIDGVKLLAATFVAIQELNAPVTEELAKAVELISEQLFVTHGDTWATVNAAAAAQGARAVQEIQKLGLYVGEPNA